jgi:hypothetical protein
MSTSAPRRACHAVPANAHLSAFGNDFECERLYRKRDNRCEALVIPEHAFVDDSHYGRGWHCEQGYRESAASWSEVLRSLKERGAVGVYACATHGIFAGDAITIMARSMLLETVVTNTIPLPPECDGARIKVISVAPLFAEAIMRIHKDLSLSALFS